MHGRLFWQYLQIQMHKTRCSEGVTQKGVALFEELSSILHKIGIELKFKYLASDD